MNPRRTYSKLALWALAVVVPVVALVLWDRLPKFEAVRLLREAGVEQSPLGLYQAIDREDLSAVQLLHTAQVPIDGAGQTGDTPLVASIKRRSLPIIEFLMTQPEVDCDLPDEEGMTPLGHAIMAEHWDSVRKLMLYVEDPNVMVWDEKGERVHALLEATRARNGRLLRLLLMHPEIDVNVRGQCGNSPMHEAVAHADLLVARVLFSGAGQPDLEMTDGEGRTPLALAVETERSTAVSLLLGMGARPSATVMAGYVQKAMGNRDAETLRCLLAHGGDPNARHSEAEVSLLRYAMEEAKLGCALVLLDSGARADGVLHRSIECGDGLAAQLVAAHFENNHLSASLSEDGLLAMAMESGDPDCLELLLNQGADPNQFATSGQRVLVEAIASGKALLVERLLRLGADPDLRMEHPPTPAFLGHFKGDAKTLYYIKHDKELSPLMFAALVQEEEAVRYLLQYGASTNGYTARYKRYAVAFAAERHNVPIMQMILGREANDERRKVVVSLENQKAIMYADGEAVNTSKVSTGKRGYRTRPGKYVITNKHRHHRSSIYGSSMPFFMRLSCGDFGLHYSGSVPSYPASHGCIRMPWNKAQEFFKAMQVGDIVVIE